MVRKVIKRDVPLTDEEVLKKLPMIFCSLDGKKPKLDNEKLNKLVEFMRWNY